MAQKLYLHIGTPKTGSTAIQAFCYRNRKLLQEHGVLYPAFKLSETLGDGRYAQDGNAGHIACRKGSEEEQAQMIFDRIGNAETTILSAETFWDHDHSFLRKIIEYLVEKAPSLSIDVIVYLRNQADYFESLYRENIQVWPITATAQEAFEMLRGGTDILPTDKNYPLQDIIGSCDYEKWLSELLDVLPKQNIYVRNYDQIRRERRDVIDDFFEILGIDATKGFVKEKTLANPSIGIELLEIKRVLNQWLEEGDCEFLGDEIRARFAGHIHEPVKTTLFSHEQRMWIFEKYREGNRRLQKIFFGRDEDMFCPPEERPLERSNEKKYVDDAIRILSAAISDQHKEIIRLRGKMFFGGKNTMQVIGWGCGGCFQRNLPHIKKCTEMKYVCDNDPGKWGQEIAEGIQCISPDQLSKMQQIQDVFVVIFVDDISSAFEIASGLPALGVLNFTHVSNWL